MKKPFVIYVSENTERKENKSTWVGHLVECNDKDSGDVFAIEVMMNEKVGEDRIVEACFKAAAKNELVNLSGNTFEYEYLGRSGKVLEIEQYTFSTEKSPRTTEAEETLSNYQPG